MSTTTNELTTTAPSRTPLLATLGFAASAVLTAMGTFWDPTGNESGDHHSFSDYWPVLLIAAVATAIAFGLVVRTAESGNPGRRAAILGVVAALSFVVFWAGLPAVLASAAVACALVQKDRDGSFNTASLVGVTGAVLAVAAAVVLAVVG
ncbi:MAG TPA: hypothetical protein VM097_05805 [Mycobacteriales bacterium]|nr:hypothetical protein [Mycobacteriales bacterium]